MVQYTPVDLSRNKVAWASFGGPIAVIRDDSKIVQLYAESALRKLCIFNSAGVLLSETVWNHPGGRLSGGAKPMFHIGHNSIIIDKKNIHESWTHDMWVKLRYFNQFTTAATL